MYTAGFAWSGALYGVQDHSNWSKTDRDIN